MTGHADPFELAFGPFVPDQFEAIQAALEQSGADPFERDAWTLSRPGAELLRALRPDSGLGEGVDELVALAHAAYLFWQDGKRIGMVSRSVLDAVLASGRETGPVGHLRGAYYVESPPRRIWGTPVAGAPPEPLDGWFAVSQEDRLGMVAVFGLIAGRPGFTVVHVDGPTPGELRREDGTAPFAPVLPGAASAGLWSITGTDELLDLGWRLHRRVVARGGLLPGRQEIVA